LSSIELYHKCIDLAHVFWKLEVLVDDLGCENPCDVLDCAKYSLAMILLFVPITEFDSFIVAFGCAGRYNRSKSTCAQYVSMEMRS